MNRKKSIKPSTKGSGIMKRRSFVKLLSALPLLPTALLAKDGSAQELNAPITLAQRGKAATPASSGSIRGPAECDDDGNGVFESLAGHDIQRLDVIFDQLDYGFAR